MRAILLVLAAVVGSCVAVSPAAAQQVLPQLAPRSAGESANPIGAPPAPQPPPLPEGLTRLAPDQEIWVNRDRTQVILGGHVCLNRGALEMFACPEGSKEHESIVAIHGRPQIAHAALLVTGAQAGRPVRFTPQYSPATGTEVEITVVWMDASGRVQRTRAQDWVRDARTKSVMNHHWVFAGSGFWTDETDGRQYYLADSGDFICVSNFPSATLDLPIESTAANASLLYEAFTENIPPLDTPVQVILTPRLVLDTGN